MDFTNIGDYDHTRFGTEITGDRDKKCIEGNKNIRIAIKIRYKLDWLFYIEFQLSTFDYFG